jgi:hypothetical protein
MWNGFASLDFHIRSDPEPSIAKEEACKQGLEEKARGFVKKGAEVNAQA